MNLSANQATNLKNSLREYMALNNLSLKQLQQVSTLSEVDVYVRGEAKQLRGKTKEKLARLLGRPLDDIVGPAGTTRRVRQQKKKAARVRPATNGNGSGVASILLPGFKDCAVVFPLDISLDDLKALMKRMGIARVEFRGVSG